jgi:hypothetical protein
MIWKRRHQSFTEWLADNPEPSLQELVERHGGYSRVPPEAAQFDAAMRRWQEAYRKRHEAEQ